MTDPEALFDEIAGALSVVERRGDPLQLFRAQRAADLAALVIDTAKAMLEPVPPPTGGPWRRAVRSKNRRIRRKGEKMRAPAWAAKRAISLMMLGVLAEARQVAIMSRKPPGSTEPFMVIEVPRPEVK